MPTSALAAPTRPVVKIDGTALTAEANAKLIGAVVVDRLTAPDTFQLVFEDPNRTVLADAKLKIGAAVEIEGQTGTDGELVNLIKGEVTAIEFEYDARGGRAIVRGYDKSHRLAAGRKTATFQDMSYSDIAKQIASDAGFSPEVDSTDGVFEHVFQVNQSDLDFLYGLARMANCDFRVDGDTLQFKSLVPSDDGPEAGGAEDTNPSQLVCGQNLREFRARVSAVGQVAKVEVRGWDIKEKKEVTATAEPTATHAGVKLKPGALAKAVGGKTLVVVNHGVPDADTADRMAKARAEQIGSAAFEATGVTTGDATLKAGKAVSVSGVGEDLTGKWVIAGTRHEFLDGEYRTQVEFTGRQDRSLFGVFNQGSGGGGGGGSERVPGVVSAIVDGNADPMKLGRVRLKYPWMGEKAVSSWARLAAPGAGKDTGLAWMPQVGDEVLVAFEYGDTSRPIVLGGLWNGTDTMPFNYDTDLDNDGTVTYFGMTSRTGHKISVRESDKDSSIKLETAKGAVTVVLDDKNKEVRIETTGKMVFDAQQDVEIKAGGSMKLEATGTMTVKGASISLE